MTARRTSIALFVVAGLGVALFIAFVISPLASSDPDGLERVAIDHGFDGRAADSAVAGSPLADYSTAGVDSPWLSTGLSGVIGVAICFAIGTGLVLLIRVVRSRRAAQPTAPDAPPTA